MVRRLRIPLAAIIFALILSLACTAWAEGQVRTETKTIHYRSDLKIVIDGRLTVSDPIPFIVDPGWIMVPAEFISKEMGATVTWDNNTGTLSITSKNPGSTSGQTGQAATPAAAMDVKGVVAKVSPSVVLVTTYDSTGQGLAQGSGVVVARNLIVTNLHVITGASKVTVIDSAGKNYGCPGVVGIDEVNDLALLSCETSLTPVSLGATGKVSVGDAAVAIGNPRGLQGSASDGIVSGIRNIDGRDYVQTTAPLSPGSSGGGLFAMDCTLLGITTMVLRDSQNLNLAVPVETVSGLMAKQASLVAFPVPIPEVAPGTTVTYTFADGDKYEGEVDEEGKPHGMGTYTWGDSGDIYDGQWYHGDRSGFGKCVWSDGEVYVGQWYDGYPEGYGTTTYPNGDQFEGQYFEGYRYGLGIYRWADGRKLSGEWKHDDLDGLGMFTMPNGSKFVGEYKEGDRSGLGVQMSPDGRVEAGIWVNDIKTSSGSK